jgi:hypothetical protein
VKLVAAIAVACALVIVPTAKSTVSASIISGVHGDNGWYVSPVKVQITSTGSGTCPNAVITFTTSSDTFQCTDDGIQLGPLQFNIDTTPPTVSGETADRAPDKNGWYTHPVTVAFQGTDGTSGIASCSCTTYSGPDSSSGAASGTCRDKAGNVSSGASLSLKYDATAPAVTASPARAADSDGWYDHPVAVTFSGNDATSGIDSCSGNVTYSGPDDGSAALGGSCVDQAGNRGSATLALHYDATPPKTSATPARPPDANGWYRRPVKVSFTGSDALSGIASCTAPTTYSRSGNGHADGSCTDKAGNVAAASVPIRYDATAPRATGLAVTLGNGDATLTWHQPADTTAVTVTRTPGRNGAGPSPIYRGHASRFTDKSLKPGVTYRYTLTTTDAAGNTAQAKTSATLRTLYAPVPGGRAKAGDVLAWLPSAGASYYNVQLFLHGRKVLSIWPVTNSLRLPRAWKFAGHAYTLERGTYKWYVWPGHGARSAARYGRMLGGSSFRVR